MIVTVLLVICALTKMWRLLTMIRNVMCVIGMHITYAFRRMISEWHVSNVKKMMINQQNR